MRFFAVHCGQCSMPATVITHDECLVVQADQALWRAKCLYKDTTLGKRMCRNLHMAVAAAERHDAGQDDPPEMVG
jgi:hypothetical protein